MKQRVNKRLFSTVNQGLVTEEKPGLFWLFRLSESNTFAKPSVFIPLFGGEMAAALKHVDLLGLEKLSNKPTSRRPPAAAAATSQEIKANDEHFSLS